MAKYKSSSEWKEKIEKIRYVNKKILYIVLAAVTVVILFFSSYFNLVPFNFHSGKLKFLIGLLLVIWSLPIFFKDKMRENKPLLKNIWQIPFWILCVFLSLSILISFFTAPLFLSKNYQQLISVKDNGNFAESIEDYTTMQIPIVDKNLAIKLGDKRLGEDNLGSQFSVGEYTMINYKDNLYWIAPIEFDGFFPWANRQYSPGYILINANAPSDVQLIKEELKYCQSAYLWNDLKRNTYYKHMELYVDEDIRLELDDEGNPMYIQSVLNNRFATYSGTDVMGCVITNPKTGQTDFYKTQDVPVWVDHVQTENIVISQLNYWGLYVHGFFNSLFAKKDVLTVSTGVNYVYSNGQMYLQTGMTSIGSDEAIVGLIMVDMRTKETTFCRVGGATEYAAAQSAIGLEQAMKFASSDPIMINVSGIPTYFMMLKDDEGLVKRYAYVNVRDYTIVTTASTRDTALAQYRAKLSISSEDHEKLLIIRDIKQIITGGETYYYIRFENDGTEEDGFENTIFTASVSLNPELAFMQAGNQVSVTFTTGEHENTISAIALKK